MIKHYTNILSQQEINTYIDILRDNYYKKNYNENAEHASPHTIEYGYLPDLNSCVEKLDKLVKADFGNDYIFTQNYARIYTNNSYLLPHLDRHGLEVAVSVNLFDDTNIDWPLYVSNIFLNGEHLSTFEKIEEELYYICKYFFEKNNISLIELNMLSLSNNKQKKLVNFLKNHLMNSQSYTTKPGDAVACIGSNTLHWRYPLVCREQSKYIQVFYFWKKK
jgi:hypothetical protein